MGGEATSLACHSGRRPHVASPLPGPLCSHCLPSAEACGRGDAKHPHQTRGHSTLCYKTTQEAGGRLCTPAWQLSLTAVFRETEKHLSLLIQQLTPAVARPSRGWSVWSVALEKLLQEAHRKPSPSPRVPAGLHRGNYFLGFHSLQFADRLPGGSLTGRKIRASRGRASLVHASRQGRLPSSPAEGASTHWRQQGGLRRKHLPRDNCSEPNR